MFSPRSTSVGNWRISVGTIRRQVLLNAFKLFDLALMVFAFGLATVVASHASAASLDQFLEIRIKIPNFVIFVALLFCWHLICSMCGLYASRRLSSRQDQRLDLVKATSIVPFVIFLGHSLLHLSLLTPQFLTAFRCS